MERWSYETHRDETWIYGKTYVNGEFTTNWMKLLRYPSYEEIQARASRKAQEMPHIGELLPYLL